MTGMQTEMAEAIEEAAQERAAAISRAAASLGIDPEDEGAYNALDALFNTAWYSGQGWKHSR